jgi:hypothetical protein
VRLEVIDSKPGAMTDLLATTTAKSRFQASLGLLSEVFTTFVILIV